MKPDAPGRRRIYRHAHPHTTGEDKLAGHHNAWCTILRMLTSEEADLEETGPMYKVRFDDGCVEDVFADELGLVARDVGGRHEPARPQ